MGKNGEKISEKVQKTAVFGLKSGKNSTFLKKQFASDSVIRWFESSYPSQIVPNPNTRIRRFSFLVGKSRTSQFMHDFVNKQHTIVHIFYLYTLSLRPILAENQRLGRDWGVNGE